MARAALDDATTADDRAACAAVEDGAGLAELVFLGREGEVLDVVLVGLWEQDDDLAAGQVEIEPELEGRLDPDAPFRARPVSLTGLAKTSGGALLERVRRSAVRARHPMSRGVLRVLWDRLGGDPETWPAAGFRWFWRTAAPGRARGPPPRRRPMDPLDDLNRLSTDPLDIKE